MGSRLIRALYLLSEKIVFCYFFFLPSRIPFHVCDRYCLFFACQLSDRWLFVSVLTVVGGIHGCQQWLSSDMWFGQCTLKLMGWFLWSALLGLFEKYLFSLSPLKQYPVTELSSLCAPAQIWVFVRRWVRLCIIALYGLGNGPFG